MLPPSPPRVGDASILNAITKTATALAALNATA